MSRRRKNPPARPVAGVRESRLHVLGRAALLVAVTFLAYLPALQGGFVMDDNVYVTEQPVNRSLDGLRRIWFEPLSTPQFYPLTHTTFWLEYQLWRQNPVGYHAVNLILFACIVVLTWRLLWRLQVPGAWLAAAIFAVHPVCVESVAWVTKLMNLQSMLLALGSIWCYLQFEPPTVVENDPRRDVLRWRYYALSLALFLLALLSKTVVASLPAVLLVLYWWKRGKIGWRDVWPLVPFLILGIVFGLMTAWLERFHSGAEGADWSLTLVQRCLLAGRAVWFYASKLVWPYRLSFFYPRWTIDLGVWWQWMYPAGVLCVVIALWLLRNRIGRGPLAAVLIYIGVLFPALGFFNVFAFRYSYVADHYQFHAILALAVPAAAAWSLWRQRANGAIRSATVATAVLVTGVFAILTWQQCRLYADRITLYSASAEKNPDNWTVHMRLGWAYVILKKEPEKSIEHCQQVLRIRPDMPEAYNCLATAHFIQGKPQEAIENLEHALRLNPDYQDAHNNLGRILAQQGQLPEAISHFQEALRLKPNYAEAERNLADALQQSGRLQEAVKHGQNALRLEPNYPDAYFNLGDAMLEAGRLSEAIEHYQQGLRLKPDVEKVRVQLGEALLQAGRPTQAIEQYQQALQIKPDYPEAHNNLANALLQSGRPEEALEHYQQALRLKPDYTDAHNNLANLLKLTGQIPQAIEHYQQALRLKPDAPQIHVNLGITLKQAGRLEEAIGHYQEALRLKPEYAEAHSNLGNALVLLGRTQEAVEHYQQSLRLKPDAPWVYANLGRALIAAGQSQQAIERFEKALQLKPDMPDVVLDLAKAYAQLNRSAEAIDAAQKALELARASGQTDLVQQIESWLTAYRATLKDSQDTSPQPEPKSP